MHVLSPPAGGPRVPTPCPCLPAGVEKPEAEARRELPEGDVLPGAPLPDLHEAEDAEHRPGHRGEPQRAAPGPLQVPQRDQRPAGLSDFQVRHVLPQKLTVFYVTGRTVPVINPKDRTSITCNSTN